MRFLFVFLLFLINSAIAAPSFQLTPLGVYGGLNDSNLSAYLLKPIESKTYVMLDAGTLVNGLNIAVDKHAIKDRSVADLLKTDITAYLISHAHLDHLMGLIMAQPELRQQQSILGRQETMDTLKKYIFNWSVWGNFGDSGEYPQLNYQHYQNINLHEWTPIPGTAMQVKAFPLSHGNVPSTAFLIRYKNDYILYFGDTGSDKIEISSNMRNIWMEVAHLVREKQLHAIMLECSFSNNQPNDKLFGHLKPELFISELNELAKIVDPLNPKTSLEGLNVIVTHIKPTLEESQHVRKRIYNELLENNNLGVNLILPEQGNALLI